MKQSDITLFETSNYSVFNRQSGNRALHKGNLKSIKEKITKNNMLQYHPLLVNTKMEVIDGQHRLEVAKEMGLEVSFIIVPEAEIKETIMINTVGTKWSMYDYLESYIELGINEYIEFKDFMNANKFMTLAQCLYSITGGKSSDDFKEGRLSTSDISSGYLVAEKMRGFEQVDIRLMKSTRVSRVIRLMVSRGIVWDHKRLIRQAMENVPLLLSAKGSELETQEALESIYNKRLRTKVSFKA